MSFYVSTAEAYRSKRIGSRMASDGSEVSIPDDELLENVLYLDIKIGDMLNETISEMRAARDMVDNLACERPCPLTAKLLNALLKKLARNKLPANGSRWRRQHKIYRELGIMDEHIVVSCAIQDAFASLHRLVDEAAKRKRLFVRMQHRGLVPGVRSPDASSALLHFCTFVSTM